MSLLGLPNETLSQIFGEVGPEYFHQDIGRLTVSWHWFELAYRECHQHIELNGRTVGLLAALLTENAPVIESAFGIARKLTLRIDEPATDIARKRTLLLTEPATDIPNAAAINANLVALGPLIRRARRLKTLHIHATLPQRLFLDMAAVYLLLPPPGQLQELVLDIPARLKIKVPGPPEELIITPDGSLFATFRYYNPPEPGHHICTAVAAMIPTLRVLHVRMGSLCPGILAVPKSHGNELQLPEIVFNFNLKGPVRHERHSQQCGHPTTYTVDWLDYEMVRAAERLLPRTEKLAMLRIIRTDTDGDELVAHDIRRDIPFHFRAPLREEDPWNAPGAPPQPPPVRHPAPVFRSDSDCDWGSSVSDSEDEPVSDSINVSSPDSEGASDKSDV